MPVQAEGPSNGGVKPRKSETWEFRLIFFMCFVVFLSAAIVERLLPATWRGRPAGFQASKSIVAEAREAASICSAYAFMG